MGQENRGRATRRHEAMKAKRRARFRLRRWGWSEDSVSKKHLGIYSNTKCPCSCHLCGNPRRHFKIKTFQERRSEFELLEGDGSE